MNFLKIFILCLNMEILKIELLDSNLKTKKYKVVIKYKLDGKVRNKTV